MGSSHSHGAHDHGPRGGASGPQPHCELPAHECQGVSVDLARRRKERSGLFAALAITAVVFVAELVGGIVSRSLALQSDAAHMFADLVALGISAAGIAIATRPVDSRRTWGYYRLEILSALANGALLTLVAFFIVREAWERFRNPAAIDVPTMLWIAAIGLAANVASMALLARVRGSLPVRGAFLHVLGDLLSSVAVVVGGVSILLTGRMWIDAALSILLAGMIVVNAWGLIKEAVDILLEGIPLGFEIDSVRRSIEEIHGVRDVHDIHIWTITSGMFAFSCHVSIADGVTDAERDAILTAAKTVLHDRFGIDHSTIQVEGPSWSEIGMVH